MKNPKVDANSKQKTGKTKTDFFCKRTDWKCLSRVSSMCLISVYSFILYIWLVYVSISFSFFRKGFTLVLFLTEEFDCEYIITILERNLVSTFASN